MTLDIPPDPEEESLDWLEGLQGDDEDIEGGDQENVFLPEEEEETPDWMKDDFGSEAAEEDAEEEVPDWLGNIREAEGTNQESDSGASESSEEESSAWLENIREAEGTDQESDTGAFESSEEESSEWLENIQNLEGESPAAEAEDTGDFMEKIHEKIEEDTLDAGEESEAGGDWLSGLDPETSDEDIQADDSSDLMGGLEEDSQSEPFQEAASEAPAELPDWMQSQETPEADSGYDEQAPDWMETEKTAEDEGIDPPAFDTGEGAGLSSGFLEDTDTAASQVDAEFPGLPGEPGEGAAVMPSWLDDLEEKSPNLDMGGEIPEEYLPSAPAFVTETDDAPSEGIKTLPTFAKEDDTTPTPVRIPDSPEEEEINLARAELPDWLQAMRPEGEGLSEEPAAAVVQQ